MKSVGIIVEYNPFHNGHAYHLQQAKKKTNADIVIAVMSGYFLQRGEPALASKWTRAKMALAGGADLVVELPYAFATQKAEVFANGAVSLLKALQTDAICFGSEEGDIDAFHELLSFHQANEELLDTEINKEMKKGLSYPKAASNAFQKIKHTGLLDLSLPNNILGFHYVKAIKEQQAPIEALTVRRTKSGYHDETPASPTIASATSIRNEINSKRSIQTIQQYVPDASLFLLKKEFDTFGKLISWEDLFPFLKYKLLTSSPGELQTIYEIEEGIENRFMQYIKEAENFKEFIQKVKTKRFTWTRLQRMCTHILTNAKKEEMQKALTSKKATYIRLLAMSKKGQHYLSKKKKNIELPIISKYLKQYCTLLRLDDIAASVYAMAYDQSKREKLIKSEYSTPPMKEGGI